MGDQYQSSQKKTQSINVLIRLSSYTAMIRARPQLQTFFLYFSESVLEAVHWYGLAEGYGSNDDTLSKGKG